MSEQQINTLAKRIKKNARKLAITIFYASTILSAAAYPSYKAYAWLYGRWEATRAADAAMVSAAALKAEEARARAEEAKAAAQAAQNTADQGVKAGNANGEALTRIENRVDEVYRLLIMRGNSGEGIAKKP